MTRSSAALPRLRLAVQQFAATAAECADHWTTPRAPGKWTPAQVVEHVARALEESGNDMAGRKTRLLALPAPIRPLVRALVLNRTVRRGTFFKAKTNPAMNPATGPASAADGARRLDEGLAAFEAEAQACAARGETVRSVVFGTVRLEDYVEFQALHVGHHRAQLRA